MAQELYACFYWLVCDEIERGMSQATFRHCKLRVLTLIPPNRVSVIPIYFKYDLSRASQQACCARHLADFSICTGLNI